MSMKEVYIFCVLPFLGGSLLCSLLTVIVRSIARSVSFTEGGSDRSHDTPRPLGGGIAIFLSIGLVVAAGLTVVFQFLPEFGEVVQETVGPRVDGISSRLNILVWLATGTVIVFVVGLLDDLMGVGSWVKILGILCAAVLVYAGGIRFSLFLEPGPILNEVVRGFVTVGWIVVITGALHLLDHMDGQCAGITFLIGLGLGAIGIYTGQVLVGTMAFLVSGSAFGFLVYNAPPANIFAGDSGSLTLGFLLSTTAVLTTFFHQQFPVRVYPAPLILFFVPLYDTASVLWIRFWDGRPLFQPDSNHFSHRIVERGYSERFTFLVTMMMTVLTCLVALALYQGGVIGTAFVTVGGLILIGGIWCLEASPE